MRYKLNISSTQLSCEVAETEAGRLDVEIGGKKYGVAYMPISRHCVALDIDGRRVNAYVAETVGGKQVIIDGRAFMVGEVDAFAALGGGGGPTEEVMKDVSPPMPAEVVRILVEEGQGVERGQGLVVVSAMKMEITLKSPRAGVVKHVKTGVGAKVMPDENLVDIE